MNWRRGAVFLLLVVALLVPRAGESSPLDDIELHGFWEARSGLRVHGDPFQEHESLAETRLQTEATWFHEDFTLQIRNDLLYDGLDESRNDLDLEQGQGFLDLREANVQFSPHDIIDLKVGRQILTWGTGDLLFINDMFPKDWQSFFLGREEEYLKAPSDALMVSAFPDVFNLDLIFTPRFDSDRYISGERVSFWNQQLGRRSGQDAIVNAAVPDEWFSDYELAARISKTVGSYELALYGYYGFWKSPGGFNLDTGQARFPDLSTYGASVRGTLGEGIANVEVGYYDSREDRSGADPLVDNSQIRALVGYQRELFTDLTGAVQWYLEFTRNHDELEANALPSQTIPDEARQLLTFRLTQLLLSQNLRLSFFMYYSPTDEDVYLRPYASYKVTDELLVVLNGNYFTGRDADTFFSRFEKNSNYNLGVRYSF